MDKQIKDTRIKVNINLSPYEEKEILFFRKLGTEFKDIKARLGISDTMIYDINTFEMSFKNPHNFGQFILHLAQLRPLHIFINEALYIEISTPE